MGKRNIYIWFWGLGMKECFVSMMVRRKNIGNEGIVIKSTSLFEILGLSLLREVFSLLHIFATRLLLFHLDGLSRRDTLISIG